MTQRHALLLIAACLLSLGAFLAGHYDGVHYARVNNCFVKE